MMKIYNLLISVLAVGLMLFFFTFLQHIEKHSRSPVMHSKSEPQLDHTVPA